MPQSERILIVEDNADIAQLMELHLTEENYAVDIAQTGRRGLEKFKSGQYDLIILDIMLPEISGNDLCQEIRNIDEVIPILIVSIRSELVDKILGLELGADDYLTKPFEIKELVARVRALLRRSNSASVEKAEEDEKDDILVRGILKIDSNRHKVWLGDQVVKLTPKQFDLLHFLAERPGRTYSRQQLLNYVWSYESSGYEHTVDATINRLRAKIEKVPSKPTYILTVWGVGYTFTEEFE